MSYNDGSNERNHWLHGLSEDGTFDSIEFRSGIIDVLHTPALALDEKLNDRSINFTDRSVFTESYNVEVNGEKFKNKISKFVNIRNKASHMGIIWNDGTDIFPHLTLLVYSSILNRAGYTSIEITRMLSWLFGRKF